MPELEYTNMFLSDEITKFKQDHLNPGNFDVAKGSVWTSTSN